MGREQEADNQPTAEMVAKGHEVLDAVLAELVREASKRLPAGEYVEKRTELWDRWKPMFFGESTPLAENPHVDAICYKYGIYGYAERLSKTAPAPSPLLWFEQFPVSDSESYMKKVKKRAKKSGKFARKHAKLVKRYSHIAPLYASDTELPDYEKAYQIEAGRREYGFDPRETWNLDYALPMMVYARVAAFKEANMAYPIEFSCREDFARYVLDPILASLEFQIAMSCTEVFEPVLELHSKDMSREEMLGVKEAIHERITAGYELLGHYLPTLWW